MEADCIYKIIIPDFVAEKLADVLDKLGIDSESIYVGKQDDEELTKIAQMIPSNCEEEINSELDRYRKRAEECSK